MLRARATYGKQYEEGGNEEGDGDREDDDKGENDDRNDEENETNAIDEKCKKVDKGKKNMKKEEDEKTEKQGGAMRCEATNRFCTFLQLLLALALCAQPVFATSETEWSPQSLRHFLIGLGPVDVDVGGGTCVLTADGRDNMLDQLEHAARASNSPDVPLVMDRWVRDQVTSNSLAGHVDDMITDRGCDADSTDCAQTGQAAEDRATAAFDPGEKASVERSDSDDDAQERRRLTVGGDCPATCAGETCDHWSNTCSELEYDYGCDCSGCDRCSPTAVPSSPTTNVPSASLVPTASQTPTPAPTSSQRPTSSSPTATPLEVEAAVAQAAASGASLAVSLVVDIVMTGVLDIFSPVTLRSDTSAVLKGGRTTKLFQIWGPGGMLSGANMTLRGGYTSGSGGAVYVATGGVLDFSGCTLMGNSAGSNGGAVCNTGGTTSFANCALSGNLAYLGGAVHMATEGALEFSGCTLMRNTAVYGGAVYNRLGTTSFSNCTISGNSADGSGGALANDAGTTSFANCAMTGNSAWEGGALYNNDGGTTSFADCAMTGNSAWRGGALYNNAAAADLADCTLSNNSASDFGGSVYSNSGAMRLARCAMTGNSAHFHGGAIENDGGEITLSECALANSQANRGALGCSGGTTILQRCTLFGNYATNFGGALYQAGGEVSFADCTLSDNVAGQNKGAIAYTATVATTRFDRCTFLGAAYDSTTCVLYSEDTESEFLFYYHLEFENGAVCAASPVLVYSSNVSIPLSSSHEATVMACQSPNIIEFCAYDCSGGAESAGGISCTCTVDEQPVDPELVDRVGGCDNSALLTMPETVFTLAVTKHSDSSSLRVVFGNAGDKPLVWNVTTLSKNSSGDAQWSATPTSGTLVGCDLGTVEVVLPTWKLPARADPYELQLLLESNSYRDAMHAISISAFVAPDAVASKSIVRIRSPVEQLAAGDSVHFTVTPIDVADIIILDSANLAYFATLTHSTTNTEVSCRVAFDTTSGQQEGSCEIPAFVCYSVDSRSDECALSPPVGEFVLNAKDAEGTSVGATQSVSIENCPDTFYYRDGQCAPCPKHVECSTGSLISDWQLDEGYWRSGDESEDIRECRFGPLSCPAGNITNERDDPYCTAAYRGPLCAQCSADHFMSWAGDGTCHKCERGESHYPTIALGIAALFVCSAAVGAAYA